MRRKPDGVVIPRGSVIIGLAKGHGVEEHGSAMDQRPVTVNDRPRTLSREVYEDVRSRMIVGRLLPGCSISIRTLAAEHGMSTMPVREALKQLATEKALNGALKRAYRVPDLTDLQASNLFQIRALLEGGAAEAATGRLTSQEFTALRMQASHMETAWSEGDAETLLDANFQFHSLIYHRSGNEDLCDLIENLFVRSGPWLAKGILSLKDRSDWRADHDAIINALENVDATRARSLIEQDARWGMAYFRNRLEQPKPQHHVV